MARSKRGKKGAAGEQDLMGFVSSLFGGGGGGDGDKGSRLGWIWHAGAAIVVLGTMMASFTSIEPGQVAVRVNNATGGRTVVTQPGWIVTIPFGIHSVYILEAQEKNFTMKGDKDVDPLNVRELTVRASDGSNFHFEDTTIIFQIQDDKAETVITDGGINRGFLAWMRPYARAILRDEFGRESTISVSNPAKFGEATERAKERLNELLGVHGVEVSQIVTPRPQFTDAYEKLIEERNALGNQLEVIKSDLAAAKTRRERQLAEVNRDQNREIQEKRAELESALATATAEQANITRQVDTYKIEKVGQGQASRSAATRKAGELKGQLDAEYRSRKAQIDAFRTQPVERVMERLGESLKNVTIDIAPYANDATPSRVQYEQLGGGR